MGLRILMLGQSDPDRVMLSFANALNRYTEHKVRFVTIQGLTTEEEEFDLNIPQLNLNHDFDELEYLLRTSDIFHFHMLLDENYHLGPFLIKDFIRGKRMLHHLHGIDDHHVLSATAAQHNEQWIRLQRKVVVAVPSLLKLIPCGVWQPNLVPLFDVDFLPREDRLPSRDIVRIVQTPKRCWDENTKEYTRVTERLVADFNSVKAFLLEGKSSRECLKFKRSCHLVFDHMNGSFSNSSLESLAQGLPVFCGLDQWHIQSILQFTGADELPWQIVNTEQQLEQGMRTLILDPDLRQSIGQSSRRFMEDFWTEQHVLEILLKIYNNL